MKKVITKYRYSVILLKQLVKTDFKLRYQSSVLGYMWSLLRPLFLFLTLYIVFTVFLSVGRGIPYFSVYLLLGIVLWSFFTEVTNGSVGAIVGKGDILRKINFPRYVIIVAVSLSALINLGLNSIIIGIFMAINNVPLTWNLLLIIPLVIELYIFALGVAFFLSALFVRFRDIAYIWEIATQAGFYATPILYPLAIVSSLTVQRLLILNPMAQIIQDARYAVVSTETITIASLWGTGFVWLIPITISLLSVTLGGLYFRSRSKVFAEDV